jgi:methionine-rich copper-binding protein CopC
MLEVAALDRRRRPAYIAPRMTGTVPMPRFWLRMPLFAALSLLAGPAMAHAILLESVPAPNGELRAGHREIRLRFNSRIDAARSRIALNGPGHEGPGHGGAALDMTDSGRPDVLVCPVDLALGRYTLRWQVLAVDGHITRGDVAFTVISP